MPSPFFPGNLLNSIGLLCLCLSPPSAAVLLGGARRRLPFGASQSAACARGDAGVGPPPPCHSWAPLGQDPLGALKGGWPRGGEHQGGVGTRVSPTPVEGPGSQLPAEPGSQMLGETGRFLCGAQLLGLPEQLKERLRFPSSPAVVLSSLWEGSQLLEMTT